MCRFFLSIPYTAWPTKKMPHDSNTGSVGRKLAMGFQGSTKLCVALLNLVLPLLGLVFVQKRNQPNWQPRAKITKRWSREFWKMFGPQVTILSRPRAAYTFLTLRGTRHFCRGLILDSLLAKISTCFLHPKGSLFAARLALK